MFTLIDALWCCCLRSRATVSLFHKFMSLTQGDEENRTLLFTLSNSWPISFGKDFRSLINVVFISINEHCAKYSGNQLKFRGRQ